MLYCGGLNKNGLPGLISLNVYSAEAVIGKDYEM